MTDPVKWQLFHVIADARCAEIRRYVVEHRLEAHVEFRNTHYPEAQADLQAHGATQVPALWDGKRLLVALDEIMLALQYLTTLDD